LRTGTTIRGGEVEARGKEKGSEPKSISRTTSNEKRAELIEAPTGWKVNHERGEGESIMGKN